MALAWKTSRILPEMWEEAIMGKRTIAYSGPVTPGQLPIDTLEWKPEPQPVFAHKEAAKTRTQLLTEAAELPEDQSRIVYTFENGWTIRELMTIGDMHREGVLMGNCIDPLNSYCRPFLMDRELEFEDSEGWEEGQYYEPNLHETPDTDSRVDELLKNNATIIDALPGWREGAFLSLRDPDNLPRASYEGDSGEWLGRHNSMLKSEYEAMIAEWQEWESSGGPTKEASIIKQAAYSNGFISADPSDLDIHRLLIPNGASADRIHVTLAFLGDISNKSPEEIQILNSIVDDAAAVTGPFSATVTGDDLFGPNEDIYVLRLEAQELYSLQSFVTQGLTEAGISYADNHDFTPHLTLMYRVGERGGVPDVDFTGESFQIDHLSLVLGERKRFIPLGFGRTSNIKTAAWQDVMQKAKRYKDEGRVNLLRNGIQYIVSEVRGDSGTYETEISRQDPNSLSISGWSCTCPWGEHAWGRTRRFKKFEGRPCAHVMATLWKSQGTPLDDESDLQSNTPEGVPPPGSAPGVPDISAPPAEMVESIPTGIDEGQMGTINIPGTFSKAMRKGLDSIISGKR